ncbi:nucleoside-diphosphate sugar epimerase/dehydratase [Sphingomonas sp. 2SG]|uniref:polysaccharide biosynthesis protein n=1 Tax=Sphingomonas sp. 2SG TaxID=2502201 RepID=UPI0020162CDF|nr:nucleoside-diphosphate sugar epimerase/dehydratase [Sphingomonas sp. 2SG]
MALSLSLWLPIFFWRGIYNSIVRFIGTRTMVGIATSCILMGVGLSVMLAIGAFPGVPRTVAFIQPMVFAVLLIFSRLMARYVLLDLLNQRSSPGRRQGVLIYGAGSAGRQLALSMRHEPNMVLRGYIDDDTRLIGKHLDGVSVHGSDQVAQLVERLEVSTILLALPRISRQRRERIVRKFENISVRVLTLPAMGDLLSGSVSIGDLRAIEITDLLGRDPVPPNELLLHRTIRGFTVMVTGAGGSIGSELCRQIIRLDPTRLILVEMTEHALYSIEGELREAQEAQGYRGRPAIHAELGNIADVDTVRRLFDRWKPDTVFHAAAYKHVPLVEENVIAGMRNNISGTLNCALEAERTAVQHFILVSTDKAVRPTNVMGASKRVCELILQALAAQGSKTKFAMVRFGNVLGSSGSVVPRFQQQIQKGGPVTLTHRDVTRYFMTIPEAAQLVIQAGGMAEGGEVYVLNMGDPIFIYDLARTIIHLSGLTVRDPSNPDGDIEICEVGLRKGEKLYEELLIGNSPSPTQHSRIMQARENFIDWRTLAIHLNDLHRVLTNGDRIASLEILSTIVPEYVGAQSIRRSTAA